MKYVGRIMTVIGMFIGSGFASGKEIAVFFSRFGLYSYIFIPFAFILFFGGVFWILSQGEKGEEKFKSSKLLIFTSILVNLIFTASMMAGTMTSLKINSILMNLFLILIIFFLCCRVMKKGMGYLTKTNLILMPILIISLICCLIRNAGTEYFIKPNNAVYAGFYAILYIFMNMSSSCLVIGKMGVGMSRKERVFISLISSLILVILLFGINYTLLTNKGVLDMSLPLLEISSGGVYYLMKFVLFTGCLTSLLSVVFVNSKSLNELGIKGIWSYILCILLPFGISFLGFGNIVSYLYPVASILGGGILLSLYFSPTNKKQNMLRF